MPPDESKGSQLDAIGSLDRRQLDNTAKTLPAAARALSDCDLVHCLMEPYLSTASLVCLLKGRVLQNLTYTARQIIGAIGPHQKRVSPVLEQLAQRRKIRRNHRTLRRHLLEGFEGRRLPRQTFHGFDWWRLRFSVLLST